jgi:hypothetical protein
MSHNGINNNNNKHSLRSNTRGYGGKTLFVTASRPALGPTQPLSSGVKRPGLEADHSHPSGAEVKE